MCALCGALGASRYWTDAAGRPEFERAGAKLTRRLERSRRVDLVNAVLRAQRLALHDWGGNSYVLQNAAGRRQNVYNLAGVWAAADTLAAQPIDPLDEQLLRELEAGAGG
jgi:hypothetical protein